MELLIVGTLDGQIGAASKIAAQQGGQVILADTVERGLDILRNGKSVELVMIDVKLDVYKFISSLEQERMNVLVVACGVANDSSLAVRAIKAGAKEYIPLPPDPELIGAVLAAATRENHALIYGDKKTEAVLKTAKQIAPSEANILLTGESGTGKEIFSRFIHDNSKRANKRFVAVNCAAIPETLLESELFGYEKGAFTGAVSRRIGKFEEASDGTLLLDEISEMDIKIQAKLLRAIQEKEIDRIGGKSPIKVNTRIIATSNRNLSEAVKNGSFRQDLYYRLNVVNINIPPLRDRMDDVVVLAKHFAKKYSELNDIPLKSFSEKAEQKLLNYRWPGNVRELENTIHRAVLLSTGTDIEEDAILLDDISAVIKEVPQGEVMSGSEFSGNTLAGMERALIIDTLKHTMGNRTIAANILGISIRTLRNKLKQYQDEGLDI
ncbi:MAG: sigma-54-dependent Fis family transcriptional regulator [Alphaproteobacteria bacterium]|nr:sigma-54-dependent Fis family transcriptional regulator [Alphaproteobacteria bacterium]